MTNQELLISYLNKLAEDEISSLLDTAALMLKAKGPAESSVSSVKTADAPLFRQQTPSWQIHTSRHTSGRK